MLLAYIEKPEEKQYDLRARWEQLIQPETIRIWLYDYKKIITSPKTQWWVFQQQKTHIDENSVTSSWSGTVKWLIKLKSLAL